MTCFIVDIEIDAASVFVRVKSSLAFVWGIQIDLVLWWGSIDLFLWGGVKIDLVFVCRPKMTCF